MTKLHSAIQYTLFGVIKLMHYVEYKTHYPQVAFSADLLQWLKWNIVTYSQLYILYQLCKKEWGWTPDPHSLPCTGTINCDQHWTRKVKINSNKQHINSKTMIDDSISHNRLHCLTDVDNRYSYLSQMNFRYFMRTLTFTNYIVYWYLNFNCRKNTLNTLLGLLANS